MRMEDKEEIKNTVQKEDSIRILTIYRCRVISDLWFSIRTKIKRENIVRCCVSKYMEGCKR